MRQLLTLSIFFIFSYVHTNAQGAYTLADTAVAQRLLKDYSKLNDNNEFKNAYAKIDSAQTIYEHIFSKNSKEVGQIFILKGLFLFQQNKLDTAISIFKEGLSIQLKILGDKHKVVANSYAQIATVYLLKGKYDLSDEFFQKATNIINKDSKEISFEMADFLTMLGRKYLVRGALDDAILTYHKALDICYKLSENKSKRVGNLYHYLGVAYNNRGEIEKAEEYWKKGLATRSEILGLNHLDVGSSFNSIGLIYFNKGDYDLALDYYQKALTIWQGAFGSEHPNVAIYLGNIGNAFGQKGDLDKALEFHHKALDIRQKIFGKNHQDIAFTLNNLGIWYKRKGEFDKAIDCLKKSLDIRINVFGPNSQEVAFSLNNIGNFYDAIEDFDKEIEYCEKALDIMLKAPNKNNQTIAGTFGNIAQAYEFKKNYPKALEYYYRETPLLATNEKIVENTKCLARVYLNLENFAKADSLLQVSLDIIKFSDAKNLNNFSSFPELVKILFLKANLENCIYNKTHNQLHLKNVIQCYKTINDVIKYQLKSYITQGRKLSLFERQTEASEGIIKATLLLNDVIQIDSLQKSTFVNNEENKANLLQAQLKESNALKYAGIPNNLLNKEFTYRVDITEHEKQIIEKLNEGNSETDSSVLHISSKLFDLKQAYDALKQNLEKNYPEYYRLKYDTKTVSVEDVQKKLLSPRQTLLSYFVGDSSIFAFVVKLDTFAVFTIKKDFPLESYIKQLRDGLYGYQTASVKTEKLYEAKADSFAQAAFMLHQKLVTPLSILLTKEVILVPDGVLGYIPFDVLLSEKPKDATKFNTHHYFGKDHIISYNYSATLWQEMQNKKHKIEPTKNFVGFAPYYNGDTTVLSQIFANDLTMRKGLDSLKYSGEEVFKAQKLMGGESILDKKATKKTFEETASNYRIIHLATHGKANDKAGDYCFLAFTEQKDSIDNELLYVRDIYNLSLNADLVVLSACETGIGELKRGEGIVSLARAFAYSGAKSMVTSLWSVNDKSTMQIMENFYRNLRKGQTKNYALWKAKQDYWEKAKGEFAHPFYWSSFIPIGDMKPVKMLP
jgi:CHAT domain-containing protein/Tfp pilus assembly protein PilF